MTLLQRHFLSGLFFAFGAMLIAPEARGLGEPLVWEEHAVQRLSLAADEAYQIVFDVEDACFEFLGGNWTLAKTGAYQGNYYFTVEGPGDGTAAGRWIAEGLPVGTYRIECWVNTDNYPANARYEIIHAGGIANVTLDMNQKTPAWYSLGEFSVNRVCVVNVNNSWSGVGSRIMVDALRFTLTTALPPPPVSPIRPHIGICIDDCGQVNPTNSSQPIYEMLRLPFKMTYAVMPLQSYTNQTANEIVAWGSEVILHQPMAAISVANPGAGGITDAMTLDQVRSTIATNLDAMPHCIGLNNHMGSLITQQPVKMGVCMEELSKRGMFFFDSRTITTSVAYGMAKRYGLLTGDRDLFIDGSSVEESKALIRSLALRALHAPTVPHLAIGHVRLNTAQALVEIAPELEAMGVEVRPISQCMAQIVEIDSVPPGAEIEWEGLWEEDPADCYSKELVDGKALRISDPAASRTNWIRFRSKLHGAGLYDVFAMWGGDDTNATQITAEITDLFGKTTISVDQTKSRQEWTWLGRYPANAQGALEVLFHDKEVAQPQTPFWADAVKFIYAGPLPDYPQMWIFH
jgi:hypothetical protein